jgi:hypothetical protein
LYQDAASSVSHGFDEERGMIRPLLAPVRLTCCAQFDIVAGFDLTIFGGR